jgi:hypothetical protein
MAASLRADGIAEVLWRGHVERSEARTVIDRP